MPQPYVVKLSTNGDGTGDTEMTGDYSGAPVDFYLQGPSADQPYSAIVTRIMLYVEDTGSFDATKYGNNITLANGISLCHVDADDNVLSDFTPGNIRSSGDWAAISYDTSVSTYGSGPEFLAARLTFAKFSGGEAPGLRLNNGEKLVCTVNDDFTGLNTHRITAQGHRAF